jgi:NTP pyrophosphatase (non-canonical NTP hydrolase)
MTNQAHRLIVDVPYAPTNSFVLTVEETGFVKPVRYDLFVKRLLKVDTEVMMKLHCALGVAGEAGELADAVKKEVIYKKPLDRANIVEELGDLRFYIQGVQNLYDISEQEVLQSNANKLAKRYKDLTYSDKAAVDREDKK